MKIVQEIKVPQENVNDQNVYVVEIYYKNGDYVEKGDILIDLETSKAIFSIEAQQDGYVKYLCKEGDELPVGATIIQIYDQDFTKIKTSDNQEQITKEHTNTSGTQFSRLAQQYLREHNISADSFAGYDFVNLDDVLAKLNIERVPEDKAVETIQILDIDQDKIELRSIPPAKKREIQYLQSVQRENLDSWVAVTVQSKGLIDSLSQYLKILKQSVLPIIVFESARLLQKYPRLNAFYHNGQIAFYKDINIGIALDMGKGLKMGKIPNANELSISQTEGAIYNLANKYIDDELQAVDSTDITFSITDLYSEGVAMFFPLINKNNSAILGISSYDEQTGRFFLTLTFDHRVTEGREAAQFLNELKQRIESYIISTQDIGEEIQCYKCKLKLKDDVSGIGFVKVMTPQGEKYICNNCLKGL